MNAMARFAGAGILALRARDALQEEGMELVRHGIDLPSYEMSHDAMNHTIDMINKLPLAEVQTMRYIHIGLGSWSCALAALLIWRVWYDSWRSHKLSSQTQSGSV